MLLYLIWYFGRRFELKASVSLASIALKVFFKEISLERVFVYVLKTILTYS